MRIKKLARLRRKNVSATRLLVRGERVTKRVLRGRLEQSGYRAREFTCGASMIGPHRLCCERCLPC